MDQANYIADVAQKFGLTNATPVFTPMERGFLSKEHPLDKPVSASTLIVR
jgi:hypothetical protein